MLGDSPVLEFLFGEQIYFSQLVYCFPFISLSLQKVKNKHIEYYLKSMLLFFRSPVIYLTHFLASLCPRGCCSLDTDLVFSRGVAFSENFLLS